ncbi:MAG TPA: glycoside hydrolase family 97 N-terminal domain-containing protein, partial [Chitinophagaceae bacterium]|nr:glycoside hydrolase family 97 N-terminal domain-containing protein [Chitinophagaceae bacterium]
MLHYFFSLTGLLLSLNIIAQRSYDLYSPDSSLRLEIKTKDKLSWYLYTGKELLAQSSSVDLQLNNQKRLSDKIGISSHKNSKTKETITVPVPYRKKTVADHFNQLELTFKEPFSVQFRMYNEGMAYRIGTKFKDSIIIENENALFEFDSNASLWFAHMDKRQNADRFHTSFEA